MANKTSTKKTQTKANSVAKKTTKKLPEIKVSPKKKIIFLGSEAAPFIATGGLADVLGSLPKSLAKNAQNDVSVILPLYSNIKPEFRSKFKYLTNFNVSVAWRYQYCGVFYYEHEGVKFYFLDMNITLSEKVIFTDFLMTAKDTLSFRAQRLILLQG